MALRIKAGGVTSVVSAADAKKSGFGKIPGQHIQANKETTVTKDTTKARPQTATVTTDHKKEEKKVPTISQQH